MAKNELSATERARLDELKAVAPKTKALSANLGKRLVEAGFAQKVEGSAGRGRAFFRAV